MIAALIGALFVGLTLGILGSGGSILTVPILRYLLHHDHKAAIVESLVIVGVISASGFISSLVARQTTFRSVIVFGAPGLIGAFMGAFLGRALEGHTQYILLACIMLAAAVMMARPKKATPGAIDTTPRPAMAALALLGLAVGAVTGIVGVGGGFLIVPALVLFGRLPMREAVGASLGVIALNCAMAVGVYLKDPPEVNWQTVAIFCAIGIAGSLVGQKLSPKMPQQVLKRVFAVFIAIVALFILWRELLSS
jgi:uncharacterized membrane protein YfcA